jgi:phosphoribosylaminoimidazole carboxylase
MFLTENNLYVNEISPRVHNAGHNTINDNLTSQFEQFWRVIFNLKLGHVNNNRQSIMINILGNNHIGSYTTNKHVLSQLLAIDSVYVHMYDKKYTKPNKKLGHVTLLGDYTKYVQCQELIDKLIIPYEESFKYLKGKVAVIMGSISDMITMRPAIDILESFGIECVSNIVSAHRTPEYLYEFAKSAHNRNIKVIIAGAGGAAHLPGMTAAICDSIPVIGVPIASASMAMNGLDSLYSIVQMPKGVPVATVAINGSLNAGILAIQILAIHCPILHEKLEEYKKKTKEEVLKANLS